MLRPALLCLWAGLAACAAEPPATPAAEPSAEAAPAEPSPAEGALNDMRLRVDSEVLTEAEQQALTPDAVIAILKDGNARYAGGEITIRDHSAKMRQTAQGQFPKAAVLGCVDSRVPVEDVFDRSIGDIFVARVAGNFENTDILGSMEFATAVAGSKVILVLGHERCGAVKGAIDGVELGNLTAMLANIQPAIDAVADFEGEKSSKNPAYVARVAEENVRLTVADILERSDVIRELVDEGKVKVVGGMYDLDTGVVTLLGS